MNNRPNQNEVLLNEQVKFKEIRCIGEDGTQYGIISSNEGLAIARENNCDLVLVAPEAKPPVCKIMDYGKYKYQQDKKKKEAKKKQKVVEIKEIKLSVKIAQNDISYKVKHAIEFLEEEKHVRFRVLLKGREMANPRAGINVLENVFEMVKDYGIMDKPPSIEGRYVNMMVLPNPKVVK